MAHGGPTASHAGASVRRQTQHAAGHHYGRLLLMTALSFVAMYALMYAMVDRLDNVYNSINQVYMAGLMAASMVVIELAVMRSMYKNSTANAIILVASLVALAGFWALIRAQGAVGDTQFLRSMIPHHAGAILMCQKASIRDPGIADLCKSIVESQEAEIREMREKLAELRG